MTEQKRGCGYRKIGGTYLIGGNSGTMCGRLPLRLHVCPTCSGGIKQARGWTWVRPGQLLAGLPNCSVQSSFCSDCPMSNPNRFADATGRCGLIWVGEGFYQEVKDFLVESAEQGICRRIAQPPKSVEVGAWILLAHPKAVTLTVANLTDEDQDCLKVDEDAGPQDVVKAPGIFQVFQLLRIERCVSEADFADEDKMEALRKRGLTPVALPDDPKHRGTVYDKDEQPELSLGAH